MRRWQPACPRASGECQDTRRSNRRCATAISSRSVPNLCARPSLTRSNRRGTDPYARWCEPSRLGGQIALGLLADDGVEGRFRRRCGVARKQDRAAQPQTHSRATTTPRVRRAIQLSEEKNIALAKRYGVSRKTIAKWKAREFTSDARMGPTNPRATSHAGRRSDHSRLPLSLFGVDRSRASLRRLDPGQPVLNRE